MGFVSLLAVASTPVVEVLLLALLGAYLASPRCGLLAPSARADINRVVYAVFTPALLLASLASTVTLQDALSWWFMPVNIGIVFFAGGVLGWLAVLILRPPPHLRGLVVASCSAANFGNLLLIVIPAVCREDGNPFGGDCTGRGLSYASFSMALGGLYIWTHTNSVMKRSSEVCRRMVADQEAEAAEAHDHSKDSVSVTVTVSVRPEEKGKQEEDEPSCLSPLPSSSSNQHHTAALAPLLSSGKMTSSDSLWAKLKQGAHQIAKELMAPPTVGAVLGFTVGTVPWLRSAFIGDSAPLRVVQDSLKLLGDGTIPCVILILGGNLTKGLRKTTMSRWVIAAIVCVRYMILPVVGIVVVRTARELGFLPPDPLYQYVLMLQFALPPAMSISTMAQLYDVAQEECSVVFLWTYLVAALALTAWSTVFMSILAPA
ncbi:hypothetical protein CFC21_094890 [Triticum aestivum]|uniref:Uncharacterized protein n=2 Tax=Triticum aestivum TaxID=4565 RepID=A0A9R1LNZ7_WHEAT|nr:protein PIN-LIKES 7-like [Triticum aestivum]KAF7092387.1 hypothetical protein CFC21_094877 [Triticum aestivum]KAF7092400.1 hypothetical protein CFC21_094890 [Triticum aestivum]